ncbi:helix-turn-helix domain-containing protein [Haemophilus pittmaniae]|uniref:helix-turn-helix domain-containing protein n=1 Tax=Haemophilus pittmaniae TaxID=249188 RepID=UPI0023EF5B2F|nr:helix-turn-helix domain-containing protein [Haemophilus pittmaniae]MBS6026316.1 helix-turn-helix domain-containing protein [Haemophilus pittmaniae]
MEILTIKEAAKLLNLSYNTVYARRLEWGFFRVPGVRGWRIYRADLDRQVKKANNAHRKGVRVGDKHNKEYLCRSAKTSTASGKLTLQRKPASVFDRVVARLTNALRKSCTTN